MTAVFWADFTAKWFDLITWSIVYITVLADCPTVRRQMLDGYESKWTEFMLEQIVSLTHNEV